VKNNLLKAPRTYGIMINATSATINHNLQTELSIFRIDNVKTQLTSHSNWKQTSEEKGRISDEKESEGKIKMINKSMDACLSHTRKQKYYVIKLSNTTFICIAN